MTAIKTSTILLSSITTKMLVISLILEGFGQSLDEINRVIEALNILIASISQLVHLSTNLWYSIQFVISMLL